MITFLQVVQLNVIFYITQECRVFYFLDITMPKHNLRRRKILILLFKCKVTHVTI